MGTGGHIWYFLGSGGKQLIYMYMYMYMYMYIYIYIYIYIYHTYMALFKQLGK